MSVRINSVPKLSPGPPACPLETMFSLCAKQNDCDKCRQYAACVALYDLCQMKGMDIWEANIAFLELRRKAGYTNGKYKVIALC